MGLQRRTIQKLLREDFPGKNPLIVAAQDRAKVGADLRSQLERLAGVDTKNHGYVREDEKSRHVCSFSVIDPQMPYYHGASSFRLILDDAGRLTIKGGSYCDDSALVSDPGEVIQFAQHCKERLERHKMLRAKRGKVRDLLAQAILAQVRKLAKEERFDFMSETDEQKLKLFVKLSEENAISLQIPFKEFKEFLPHLRSVIGTLRQLHQNGIRFQIVSRRGLPWRKSWVTHESL